MESLLTTCPFEIVQNNKSKHGCAKPLKYDCQQLTKSVREKKTLWVNGYSYGLHAGGAGMAGATHVGYIDLSSTSLESMQWDDNKWDHAQRWQTQKLLVLYIYTIVETAITYRRSEQRWEDKQEKVDYFSHEAIREF